MQVQSLYASYYAPIDKIRLYPKKVIESKPQYQGQIDHELLYKTVVCP